MILKVTKGGSVVGPNNVLYRSGQIVPGGVFSDQQVKAHLASGYLRVVPGSAPVASVESKPEPEEGAVENPPGLDPTPSVGSSGDLAPAPKIASRWVLDPDALKGMTLDQLNVMVVERDESIEPFDTVEEAIEWLSQDFVPAEAR